MKDTETIEMFAPDEENEKEIFEERAAIFEYEAKMQRDEAHRKATEHIEKYRAECEARWVLNLKDKQARLNYIALVETKRGKISAQKLREDVLTEHFKRKEKKC